MLGLGGRRATADYHAAPVALSFHPSLSGGARIEWPASARLAHDAGFHAVEVVLPRIAREAPGAVLATLAGAGVVAGGAQLPVEFRRDEATFARDLARLPGLADLAAATGVKTMYRSIPASSELPRRELAAILRRRLAVCAALLRERGLVLAIEAMGPLHRRHEATHEFIWRLPDAAAFADSCGPGVGIVVDSWHWHHSGATACDIFELGARILLVHVADAPDIPAHAIRDGERLLPGQGVVDFASFFEALATAGYSGLIAPEVLGYRCAADDPVACARHALDATVGVLTRAKAPYPSS